MVGTKTCEGCGWVYPITHPDKRCRFCGTPFKKRICKLCGQFAEVAKGENICKKCKSKKVMASTTPEQALAKLQRHRARVRKKNEDKFNAWLEMISKVRKPIKTLTEDEWIRACMHFGSCATCESSSIDARGMFIPFKFGGRYAAWNIIPICDKCATALKFQHNPFIRYESGILDPIVEYLHPILEEAIK